MLDRQSLRPAPADAHRSGFPASDSTLSRSAPSSAPCMLPTSTPARNILKVGIAETPYCCETSLHSSTSTLRNLTCGRAAASSLYFGAICWHGPHQLAKKSATTSCDERAELSCWSKSALECTATTEPPLEGLATRDLRTPLAVKPLLPLPPDLAEAGGADGGGGGGAMLARSRGGLPGKATRIRTRNQAQRLLLLALAAAVSAPPRRARAARLEGRSAATGWRRHRGSTPAPWTPAPWTAEPATSDEVVASKRSAEQLARSMMWYSLCAQCRRRVTVLVWSTRRA
mmetsp:Transcript_32328/g.107878  ORF Transcript_32328/g.107878 Transcript_32328/m.107878 type:complete len:286 (+) Transcript_32328:1176-2033(+)